MARRDAIARQARALDAFWAAQGFRFEGNYADGEEFEGVRDTIIDLGGETRQTEAIDRVTGEPIPGHSGLYSK